MNAAQDSTNAWRADPLNWGHGPTVLDIFLEPTCPYSAKAFAKLAPLIAHVGAEHLTVRITLQSQPWHMFSGVIVRAILAASTLPEGKVAAQRVMAAVAAHRDAFEFEKHATGPNRDATPNDIIARIERESGVQLTEAFAIPDLDKEIKRHCKFARQNGIHVSPTFMVNGLVDPQMSSGDTIEAWAARLA